MSRCRLLTMVRPKLKTEVTTSALALTPLSVLGGNDALRRDGSLANVVEIARNSALRAGIEPALPAAPEQQKKTGPCKPATFWLVAKARQNKEENNELEPR